MADTAYEDATLRQVLDMQIGVDYSEDYADPLADIGVLADPDRITAVWTRGRPVKGAVAA